MARRLINNQQGQQVGQNQQQNRFFHPLGHVLF